MKKNQIFMQKWIHFSGLLEMGFGIFFLAVIPWILGKIGIQFPIQFFMQASGVFIFYLGATLYVSARDPQLYRMNIVLSCWMRFTMVAIEAYGAVQVWGLTPLSYVIGIAFICGAIYDAGSAWFTLKML